MKKIIAINASPRSGWNTDLLVREVAKGAEESGAEVEVIDLYNLEKHNGCMSCFLCKTPECLGKCVYKDGLAEVLEKIRNADGLILGSPIYLGDITAGLRALYERLIFQSISYKIEPPSYNKQRMAVALIFTSNCKEEYFPKIAYDTMIDGYRSKFENMFGSCKLLISSDTLQVDNYEKYDWTMFNPEAKKARRENVFPEDLKKAFEIGKNMTFFR
jgi:multimeric flavodoxin WrbA